MPNGMRNESIRPPLTQSDIFWNAVYSIEVKKGRVWPAFGLLDETILTRRWLAVCYP
jgi:hypothetical protein